MRPAFEILGAGQLCYGEKPDSHSHSDGEA